MKEGRLYGTAESISEEHARLGEHGLVLMFRDMARVDGDEAFEGVPAMFRAENGGLGASFRIGDDLYFTRLDDLEKAFENPGSSGDPELGKFNPSTREGCLEVQGALFVLRHTRELGCAHGPDDFQAG